MPIPSISSYISTGYPQRSEPDAEEKEGQSRRITPEGDSPTKGVPSKEDQLNEDEKRQVSELRKRDQEVRAHEAAHVAAGGAYVRGGASYSYQTGPDGRRYAVGGEVSIDSSPVRGNPSATVAKMQTIKRAALAPAQPSGQDRSVAAQATQAETKARQEIQQTPEKASKSGGTTRPGEVSGSEQPPKTGGYTPGGSSVPYGQDPGASTTVDIAA